jgi:hypothetical protein
LSPRGSRDEGVVRDKTAGIIVVCALIRFNSSFVFFSNFASAHFTTPPRILKRGIKPKGPKMSGRNGHGEKQAAGDSPKPDGHHVESATHGNGKKELVGVQDESYSHLDKKIDHKFDRHIVPWLFGIW